MVQAKPGGRGAIQTQIVAELECFSVWHLFRTGPRQCQRKIFWRGLLAIFEPGAGRRGPKFKLVDLSDANYFFLAPGTGVARSWLR